ncbi:MAG TPA: hypothetical protein VJ691_11880 [Vicinamibacterales bacterium]|nr:hypothetical protein [Vicinamibacterales bacterium]
MRRHLGRIAFAAGIGGWLILLGGLWMGGVDPSPDQANALRTAMAFALIAECLAVPFGFVALILGPHRVAGLFAIMFAGAFLLYFTGMIMMFFVSRG